jgi:hypothetical protein
MNSTGRSGVVVAGGDFPLGFQYPEDSDMEHLDDSGILIGAIVDSGSVPVKRVSATQFLHRPKPQDFSKPDTISHEFTPVDKSHPFIFRSRFDSTSAFAESESDVIVQYTDTGRISSVYNHYPLGLSVRQSAFSWVRTVRSPILPIEYEIVNIGSKTLRNVYIGLEFEPFLGRPTDFRNSNFQNVSGYWPELRTAFVYNPFKLDSGATPMGFTFLGSSIGTTNTTFRFRWFKDFEEDGPGRAHNNLPDSSMYDYLSGNWNPLEPPIRPPQKAFDVATVTLLFSLGPLEVFVPGETLHVGVAMLGGRAVHSGPDNLRETALTALTLAARHYVPPLALPAPRLRYEIGSGRITLRWSTQDSSHNPESIWDEENALADYYPDNHWRRRAPPFPNSKGGRVFEGYRLYRSEDPAGTPNSFTLVRQWDVIDSIGPKYEYDTGIETTFTDSNLRTGKTYWYAVTSFGIPDLHVIDYLDYDGSVKKETLFTKSAETSVLASRKRVHLSFSASHETGRVLVVPNPYRVDQDYTYESGGWEGRTRTWTENRRLIRFIHLPPICTLKIFSLSGDVVATLYHDSLPEGELDWNMLSESGRAIASGVYVFTVDSEYGRQMGKFVIIR